METDKKSKRSKFVYAGVIAVLILFFIVGFVYGLSSVLKMEGNFPPVILAEGKTPVPTSNEDAAKYLNDVVAFALKEKPAFSSGRSIKIDEDSLQTEASGTVKDTLLYVCGDFEDHLNDSFESHETEFNQDFSQMLRVPEISAEDIEEFRFEYQYYKCGSCGETSDVPKENCELCGSEYPYDLQYRDDYTVTYVLKTSEDVLRRNYLVRGENEIRALFGEGLNGVLDLQNVNAEYAALTIRAQVNRAADELKSLSYVKEMPVHVSGTFTGECAALGALDLRVNVTETERYSFTWPCISLSAHSKDIEPKDSDNLLATLTFPEASQENVQWTSSDEAVVSVDDEGYLKAGKAAGVATVTASYEFNGKTYADSCVVNVKYDVESLSLSKRKVALNTGDTFTLTAKASPKKATIKTVHWYSEDESVAVVDENGVVTAVAPGTVTVYALSDDLYFKASCEVTVK